MRYPPFLPANGSIGFIAPSFGCTTEPYRSCFDRALQVFSDLGHSVIPGPNCFKACGIGKSNTPENCGKEINSFFLRQDCDILISCGGGETMCEDLPYVDFEQIRNAPPKWFMGFSDNTNLVFTLPVLCDTAAVYGPNAPAFGMQPWHSSIEDAYRLLRGERRSVSNYDGWEADSLKSEETPFCPYHITEPFSMTVLPSGQAHFSGRLIGGCLDCLSVLCGTEFDRVSAFSEKYQNDGILWFIEACDLNPLGIRRALWQLDQAGWFRNASGFIFGRPWNFNDELMGVDRYSAVTDILGKYPVPVLLDVDIGHLPPMMPLIAGSVADVTAGKNQLRIKMNLI